MAVATKRTTTRNRTTTASRIPRFPLLADATVSDDRQGRWTSARTDRSDPWAAGRMKGLDQTSRDLGLWKWPLWSPRTRLKVLSACLSPPCRSLPLRCVSMVCRELRHRAKENTAAESDFPEAASPGARQDGGMGRTRLSPNTPN